MQKLISLFLAFLVNYYLGFSAIDAADSFPTLMLVNKKSGQLNSAHLEIAVAHVPPSNVLTKGPDGNYTHTGSSALFIDWLAEKLNFTFTYLYVPNNKLEAKYGNMGEFSILLSLLTNKEVDGVAVPAIATPQRKKLMDFAYFMWVDPHAIVVPRRGEEPRLLAFVQPFQRPVWLCILFAMLVVVCLMTLLTIIHSRFLISNKSSKTSESTHPIWHQTAGYYAIYVINIVTNQGESVPGSRSSFRILMGAWLLAAMVLVNSYSGTVVAYLTAPKMMPSINTLDDLAASEDVGLLVVDSYVLGQQIMDAQSGILKILGDQVRRHPDRLLKKILQVNPLLETGHFAFPYFQSFCDDFVAKNFKKDGICRFKTTDPITSSAFFSLLLQRNSKFTSEFYSAQMKAWEMGFPPYWMKISIQQAPKCFTQKRPEAAKKMPIAMDDLFGAFLILGVGLGLATFAFLTENVIFCYQRRVLAI